MRHRVSMKRPKVSTARVFATERPATQSNPAGSHDYPSHQRSAELAEAHHDARFASGKDRIHPIRSPAAP